MKKIQTEVYLYPELNKKAQERVYEKWLDNNYSDYLRYDLEGLLDIIEQAGYTVSGWSYDICYYSFSIEKTGKKSNSDKLQEIAGIPALKRAIRVYNKFSLSAKLYQLPSENKQLSNKTTKQPKCRLSKVVFEQGERGCDWLTASFCETLKELIDQRNLELSLYDYLFKSLDEIFRLVQSEYRKNLSLESFLENTQGYLYFEDGRFWGIDDDAENQGESNE